MSTDLAFWNGRRVLLTGHAGFKGSWLGAWLTRLGAEVTGYGHPPRHVPSLFTALHAGDRLRSIFGDVRDRAALETAARLAEPEIVLHLAAQPIVRTAIEKPVETIETNVIGTLNLLEVVRRLSSVRAIVVVTSDKCYRDPAGACREDDALGGDEPYGVSKACADLLVNTWRKTYIRPEDGVGLATARAGNVIGGGDFSRDRLVPDLVRAAASGMPAVLRHPEAVRPWQHVLDALQGYLQLAEALWHNPVRFANAWNFGPSARDAWTVARLADAVSHKLGSPGWKLDAAPAVFEAPVQRLSSARARGRLGWQPLLTTAEAVAWTIDGYSAFLATGTADWLDAQLERYATRLETDRAGLQLIPAELGSEMRHASA